MNPQDEGARRAHAWVEHLRAGGVTAWLDFASAGEATDPTAAEIPGAAHLELARRLNAVGGEDSPAHRALVERVLTTGLPGRGLPELGLVGVPDRNAFGPRPVDPALIPTDELIRVAVGALAEAAVAADPGEPSRRRVARRPWHRGLRLAGAPMAVSGVRAGLDRIGHVTGRRSPVAVVLAGDLAGMLADTWSHRIQVGKPPAWPGWVDNAHRNGALPPALDLPAVAARRAAEVGAENVHIVVGEDPGGEIARLIELRKPLPVLPNRLSGAALEVLRNTNVVMRVLVHENDHRRVLSDVLLPRLADEQGGRLAVPAPHRDWVREEAQRLRSELAEAGYPVHGNLDDLLPRESGAAPAPTEPGVLEVALRTLLKMKEGV